MTQKQTVQPEAYYLERSEFVPNNSVPALIYRDVLPKPLDPESAKALCEGNHWQKRGEWGALYNAHFHPNTHECYAVFRGGSRLALGRERQDTATGGVVVDVKAGDVIVVPAGVSHRSLSAYGDYRYIGVYPEAAPKWRSNYCRGDEDMEVLQEEIEGVNIPDHDPVYGLDGPLANIWNQASRQNKAALT